MHSASPAWFIPAKEIKNSKLALLKVQQDIHTCSHIMLSLTTAKLQRTSTALIWDPYPNLQVERSSLGQESVHLSSQIPAQIKISCIFIELWRWLIIKENGIATFFAKSTLFLSLASSITSVWSISFIVSDGWDRDPSLRYLWAASGSLTKPLVCVTPSGRTYVQRKRLSFPRFL